MPLMSMEIHPCTMHVSGIMTSLLRFAELRIYFYNVVYLFMLLHSKGGLLVLDRPIGWGINWVVNC